MLDAILMAAKCARSDLERDALAHPGFAHVSEADVLDHVSGGLAYSNTILPLGAPDTEYRGRVFSFIAGLLGVHCCLCGTIRDGGGWRTSLPFCKWLCGEFDGTCTSENRTHPLCHNCNSRVITTSRATNTPRSYVPEIQPVLHEEQFPEVLCSLYGDRAFRKRVEASAETHRTLRFDPRAARNASPPRSPVKAPGRHPE